MEEMESVVELAELASDSEAARAFLDAAYDLGVDVEALRDGDDGIGILRPDIDFETVATVEHLVHLAPVGPALLSDDAEEGRHREHVVLDDAAVLAHEVKHLGLGAARAVHHAVDSGTHLVEETPDDRGVSAGRERTRRPTEDPAPALPCREGAITFEGRGS